MPRYGKCDKSISDQYTRMFRYMHFVTRGSPKRLLSGCARRHAAPHKHPHRRGGVLYRGLHVLYTPARPDQLHMTLYRYSTYSNSDMND